MSLLHKGEATDDMQYCQGNVKLNMGHVKFLLQDLKGDNFFYGDIWIILLYWLSSQNHLQTDRNIYQLGSMLT